METLKIFGLILLFAGGLACFISTRPFAHKHDESLAMVGLALIVAAIGIGVVT